ncbi:hypothetical protein G9U51_15940 [Calidifontibacter sp. DB0510]|uniref:Peptidase S53 domain-containing protein n=1 Tax=Metallococcus carri TaxID=1656884 RepID=A0A967B3F3_9MICO|nr:protease pro-enzyme activation domain-containing protein [Metallococcus carri]NHN57264.1 hypothetical protein [Metallococcus carri]NOP37933.1 hypothetical protein [Calidifontibacter sp. DB2511S]
MKRTHVMAGVAAVTTAVGLVGTSSASAAGSGNDVRLNNSAVQATGMRQGGALADSAAMQLVFQLPLRNQAQAQAMLARGQVVTPEQYNALFGASPAAVNKVKNWAKKQGYRVTAADAGSGTVTVLTDAGTVNKTLKVTMKRATLNGVRGFAPSQSPAVPASLGVEAVSGLSSLARFKTTPPSRPATTLPRVLAGASPMVGSTACAQYWGQTNYVSTSKWPNRSNVLCGDLNTGGYSPQSIVKMYGMAGAASAKPTLGILLWDNDPNAVPNANQIATKFGYKQLATTQYSTLVDPKNVKMADCESGSKVYPEQNLDVQASHAIAPSANIRYFGAASCYMDDTGAMLQKAVTEHKVSTISMSFGQQENGSVIQAVQSLWNRALNQAALTGISVFASSGDNGGYTTKTVSIPASFPQLTAVGGTSVGLNSTGGRAMTAGWETDFWTQPNPDSTAGIARSGTDFQGAGGGNSRYFAQPNWQKGVVSGTTRALPDVAALADPYTGMTMYANGAPGVTGGTSLASPLVAAMVGASKAITGRKTGNAALSLYKLRGSSALLDTNYAGKAAELLGQDNSGNLLWAAFDANPENYLVTKAGWDNVTGVGEPFGQAFLTGFGG